MPFTRTLTFAALAALSAASVHADPLSLSSVPALSAASQVGDKFGVGIVYKSDPGLLPPVTLTVDDADAPGARLQAVNALANAVQSDFTKTFVVSSVDGDVPEVKTDTNARITFPSVTVSAADAIRTVAAVDNAVVQISPDITGTVTLSAVSLSASDAAKQIAAQTHTRWKAFYALTPRTQGRATGGRVIGYTASGSPITESPYVYYTHVPTQAERDRQAEIDAQAAQQQAQQIAQQQQAANAYNSNYGPNAAQNAATPYGYNPYGNFSPYGMGDSNPYTSGGYNPYGGNISTGTGLDITNSYGGPIVFGGGF